MKKVRSILLLIAIAAVVMTSLFLLYNRYRQDNGTGLVTRPTEQTAAGSETEGKTSEESTWVLQSGSETTSATEGARALDFELDSLDGKKVRLSDYKDQIVILNFWATWCPYCIDEMPELQSAGKKLEEDKKAVILTIDVAEDTETVKKFVEDKKLTLPVLLDSKGETAQNYGIQGFPTTIFINRDGTVYGYIPHATDEATVLSTVDKMK